MLLAFCITTFWLNNQLSNNAQCFIFSNVNVTLTNVNQHILTILSFYEHNEYSFCSSDHFFFWIIIFIKWSTVIFPSIIHALFEEFIDHNCAICSDYAQVTKCINILDCVLWLFMYHVHVCGTIFVILNCITNQFLLSF